jgi:hypothetical protein
MPQNRESGAKANEYGHEMARKIAEKIDAVPVSDSSNEFAYEGRLITIRCAKKGNNQVGCTYAMLKRVDEVFAAFEQEHNLYSIYEMSAALFLFLSRNSKIEGKVGLVSINDFLKKGKNFVSVTIAN